MNEHIPHLNIRKLENGNLMLENETMGDRYEVELHSIHVRLMAEKLGLVREMSASHADTLRTLLATERRMLILQRRIEEFGQHLAHFSDHDHADLTQEVILIAALADMADEFCADIPRYPLPACDGGNGQSVTSALPTRNVTDDVTRDGCVDGEASRNVTQLVTPMSRGLRDTPMQLEIAA